MTENQLNEKLLSFLTHSTSPYHTVQQISRILDEADFIPLDEKETWQIKAGQSYYFTRDNGSLVAFNKGFEEETGFRILGTHSDSPSLQIKPNADIYEKEFHKLGVEIYGGAQLGPWLDRDLSLAGRVCYLTTDGNLKIKVVDFNRPIAVIPSIALHLNKNTNQDNPLNPQKHIVPIIGLHKEQKKTFNEILTDHLTIEHKNLHLQRILSYDLFFYDFQKPVYVGIDNEFILSARLDNQLSCFLAATAAASANKSHNFLIVCNDHEEIGSKTAAGAEGNMLSAFFERFYPDPSQRFKILAKSFLISVDNAHATHPNYSDKHDSSHEIFLNKGPVLKINANQRYSTSSPSSAVFKLLCSEVDIQVQDFVMRNDMPCGSTLGPMTAAKVGLKTVDIGAPTLAMHSVREMTGRRDPYLLYKVMHHFFTREHIPEVR